MTPRPYLSSVEVKRRKRQPPRNRRYPGAPPGWYPGRRQAEQLHPTVWA